MDLRRELLYWTGFMRDHAIFQINALSPNEQAYISKSRCFMDFFENMYKEAEMSEDIEAVSQTVLNGLLNFIEYKKTLLKELLSCKILMNLPPTAINHQLNEAIEFKIALTTQPPQNYSNEMRLALLADRFKYWLSDSVGHAAVLADLLEPVEYSLIDDSLEYKCKFTKLASKASELQTMMTHTGQGESALLYLSEEVIRTMSDFMLLCGKLRDLRSECKAMGFGTFLPLVPDHFIREHQYFIEKTKEFLA